MAPRSVRSACDRGSYATQVQSSDGYQKFIIHYDLRQKRWISDMGDIRYHHFECLFSSELE
jgi:hypothetical protein